MNIAGINQCFKKLGAAQIRYRYLILGIFIALTAVLGSGLSRLKISGNSDGWYADTDQVKIAKRHYQDLFGNADGVAFLVIADDVFAPEVLSVIDELGKRMEKECPFADRVTSLTRVDIPRGTADGFEVVRPFAKCIPSDPAAIKAEKDLIMSRESLVNNLVSDDCRETYISLSLHAFDPALDRDEQSDTVGNFMINILEDPAYQNKGYKLYGVGLPYTDLVEANFDDEELTLRLSIALVVMLVTLALFTRHIVGVIMPSFATICAIAATLGLMAYMGEVADESLFSVPLLLGMALSVGYSIHYINMFKMEFAKTGKRKESAAKSVEDSGWAILFTVVTTVASLISFIFAGLKPISWLGKCASLIVIFVYVYTAVLIPIFLSFGRDKTPAEDANTEKTGATALDRYFEGFSERVYKRRKVIIALTVAIFALMVPGIAKIRINMDMIGMSGSEPPHIQNLITILKAKIGSVYGYQVMIEYDEEGAFKSPERMANLEEMERRIGDLRLTKKTAGKARVSSVTSIIKEFYRAFNEDDPDYFVVPEDEFVLGQIMEFCAIDMHDDFSDYMDEDCMTAVISVDMENFDSKSGIEDINQVRADLAELFPDAKCSIIGDMIEFTEMSDRLATGEVKSLLFSFLIIAALLIIAFMSIRSGLIGMIPNIAPVIVVGGVMGYLGLSLDLTSMTVGPIILGIAVDDTIHLNNHVKLMLSQVGSYREAMRVSFREIGKSMFQTTVILCAMFLVFAFSPLKYLVVLGLLLALGLAVALVADYTVTPALIFLAKPFGKEKNGEKTN